MGSNMKKIPFFALFIFTVQYGQSSIGNDLLSDLENSNKNAVYTYWIGTVNGNLRGYEYGVWYALNYLMSNGIISENESGSGRSTLDVIQSSSLLLESKISLANSERNFLLSKLKLLQSIGLLTAEYLQITQ